jgi:hypothetical protein
VAHRSPRLLFNIPASAGSQDRLIREGHRIARRLQADCFVERASGDTVPSGLCTPSAPEGWNQWGGATVYLHGAGNWLSTPRSCADHHEKLRLQSIRLPHQGGGTLALHRFPSMLEQARQKDDLLRVLVKHASKVLAHGFLIEELLARA